MPVQTLAPPSVAPVRHVPLIAKQPEVMLKPTFEVDVAEPEMFKPASVVVPNPVAETERKLESVLPLAAVEDETWKTLVLIDPKLFWIVRFASGEDVPMPILPFANAVKIEPVDVPEAVMVDVG